MTLSNEIKILANCIYEMETDKRFIFIDKIKEAMKEIEDIIARRESRRIQLLKLKKVLGDDFK